MPIPKPKQGESKEKFISTWRKSKGKREVDIKDCHLNISYREGEDGEFYSEGFIVTTHPDRFKEDEFDGTMMSKEVLNTVANSINSGKPIGQYYAGNPRIAGIGHDWIHLQDPGVEPVGIAVPPAEIRDTGDGHLGVWVKTKHNKNHPDFDKIRYDIEEGYIPGYSFEFLEGDSQPITVGNRMLKLIKNIKEFLGYTFASARKIANPAAVITACGYREVEAAIESEKNSKEENKMSDEVKTEEVPKVEPKEETTEEKPKEEVTPVEESKEEPAKEEVKPEEREVKVPSVREVADQIKSSEEFKKEIDKVEIKSRVLKTGGEDTMKIKIRELNDALNDAVKFRQIVETEDLINVALNDPTSYGANLSSSLKVRCEEKGLRIVGGLKVRSTLDTASNTSDYTQSSVEFADLFAPGIIDTFNTQTNFFGFIRKEQHIGGYFYQWKMVTDKDPDSNETFVDRDDVTVMKQFSNKLNYQTPIKVARRGVSVADFTLRYAAKSLGDLFQLELHLQMTKLMKDVNISLFAEVADGTGNNPLGLEAVADGAGNSTLYGYSRSAANRLLPDTAANTYESISGNLVEAKLRTKYDYLETEGSRKQDLAIITSPTGRSYFFNLLDGSRRFNTTEAMFGFNRMSVPSHDGLPIIVDTDCASTATASTGAPIYIIDTETNVLVMAMEPKIISLAKVGAGTEAYIEMHFAHVYKQPRRISLMDSITGPST